MSTARELKKEQVECIKSKITNCQSFVAVEYKGITVEQDTKLRAKFRQAGVEYRVLKNRLVKIALNELGYDQFDSALENCTAIAFANNDALAAAKIVTDGTKEIKCLITKCGLFEGKYVNADVVTKLASIPSREVLLAQLCGLLTSGLSGLASVLSQIAEKKAN